MILKILKSKKQIENFNFSIEKSIFSSKNVTWKNRFFQWKSQNFRLFFDFKNFKIIFLQDFFSFSIRIFFSVLEIFSTSRIYAQNCLGITFPSWPLFFTQNPAVTTFFWEGLSYEDTGTYLKNPSEGEVNKGFLGISLTYVIGSL